MKNKMEQQINKKYWFREFGTNLWLLTIFIFMNIWMIIGYNMYSWDFPQWIPFVISAVFYIDYLYLFYKWGFNKIQDKIGVVK